MAKSVILKIKKKKAKLRKNIYKSYYRKKLSSLMYKEYN